MCTSSLGNTSCQRVVRLKVSLKYITIKLSFFQKLLKTFGQTQIIFEKKIFFLLTLKIQIIRKKSLFFFEIIIYSIINIFIFYLKHCNNHQYTSHHEQPISNS